MDHNLVEKGKEDSIDKLFKILFQENEIEWQSVLINLVKTEEMDPWDIDISLLSKRLVELITRMQEIDFKIPAKVLLASAILLRLKSEKLLEEFLSRFESLTQGESVEEQFFANFFDTENVFYYQQYEKRDLDSEPTLAPKIPLPRKRKVSIYDLIEALEKVFEMEAKRVVRKKRLKEVNVRKPEKRVELTEFIERLYKQLLEFFKTKKEIDFESFVKSKDKSDIILTLLSLLHLEMDKKITLIQEKPFSKINIVLNKV